VSDDYLGLFVRDVGELCHPNVVISTIFGIVGVGGEGDSGDGVAYVVGDGYVKKSS
jgi:hypothetical protein